MTKYILIVHAAMEKLLEPKSRVEPIKQGP
jgi:hypothetical protein